EAAAARAPGAEARFTEPLPDVAASDVISLVEHLQARDGEDEVYRIADETNREFGRVIAVVKAAEMLGFVDTPQQLVVLTQRGVAFATANAEERHALW